MSLGIYLSVPFCKQKCTFCNFVSGVFPRRKMQDYIEKVVAEMENAEQTAGKLGAKFEKEADSVYLGGGTPTTLSPDQLELLFTAVRQHFNVAPDAEITIECAPGTLSKEMLATMQRCGVNRVSLGVQSFVDAESHAVGRTHTRVSTLEDIARLRNADITNIGVDLIAGLPLQTRESWEECLAQTIAARVPHVSVYILEVDEDSRLGRELIAGGTRYHAHHVPDEDTCADMYSIACERLNAAGIAQYEISNFARAGFESRHNLKYWTRQAYLGFGLDAHSMLLAGATQSPNAEGVAAVRFSTTDNLDAYLVGGEGYRSNCVTHAEAMEEELFLGLRQNRGIDLHQIAQRAQMPITTEQQQAIDELIVDRLILSEGSSIMLSPRGRLLSNEVFARFIADKTAAAV